MASSAARPVRRAVGMAILRVLSVTFLYISPQLTPTSNRS